MDDQIGLDLGASRRVHAKAVGLSFDTLDARTEPHIDAATARGGQEHVNEVGIESFQRTRTAVQDGDLGSSAHRDVRELEGDVATAHEGDAARERVELRNCSLVIRCSAPGKRSVAGRAPVAMTK